MSDDLTPYEVGPVERFPGVPFESRILRGGAAGNGSVIDDLAAFFAARLDEQEQRARGMIAAFGQAEWMIAENGEFDYTITAGALAEDAIADLWREDAAAWVCIHDPARVLREVAGKRKILAEHEKVTRLAALTGQELGFLGWYREWVLKNLAAAWSDHPDYRQEWKP